MSGLERLACILKILINNFFLIIGGTNNSDSFRKYSMNRYYGFYLDDMVQVKTLSPYITPFIKTDAVILENNNEVKRHVGSISLENLKQLING